MATAAQEILFTKFPKKVSLSMGFCSNILNQALSQHRYCASLFPCANSSTLLTYGFVSELHELINSTSSPSSPFHISNLTTDSTVYPPPTAASDEPESKKRKLTEASVNGKTESAHVDVGARYTNQMLSNQHVLKVHSIVKKECEELADSIVR